MLWSFLPAEIVDMIYLRTDFFTAIKHIPHRKHVLKILFEKNISRVHCSGNWGYGNKDYISIQTILNRRCRDSLVYFREARPHLPLRYNFFKYDDNCKIDLRLDWNLLLISVFKLKSSQLRYFEARHRVVHNRYGSI